MDSVLVQTRARDARHRVAHLGSVSLCVWFPGSREMNQRRTGVVCSRTTVPHVRFALLMLTAFFLTAPVADARDLATYARPLIRARTPGLQMALYKFYSPLFSVPDLDGRRPDLVVKLDSIDQANPSAAWPEVAARWADTPDGFDRFDGDAYSGRFAARITGQIKVERSNTFAFELDNREGARLFLDGALRVNNDFSAAETYEQGARKRYVNVYLSEGYHNIRVEYFVDATWSQLRLWQSGPGLTRRIVPGTLFFLPDETCCLCSCAGGSCRVAEYGTGAVQCSWPSEVSLRESMRPAGNEKCKEPCEDPGSASGLTDFDKSPHESEL